MLADYHTGGREMNKREPAFPQNETSCQADWCPQGMTLRDYFAAKMMAADIAANDFERDMTDEGIAQRAYLMADALLEERKK